MKLKAPNFKDRKTQLAAGGAAAVVAFALYKRHVAGAATGSTAAGVASTGLTDPIASAAFGQASLENSIVSDLQPQLDQLAKEISGLQAGNPKPPNPPPVVPPVGPRKPPTHVPLPPRTVTKPILGILNPDDFLHSLGGTSKDLLSIGSIGPGGLFSGHNVGGHAPVYFETPGSAVAVQGLSKPPAGTKVFTLQSLKAYVSPKSVTGQR